MNGTVSLSDRLRGSGSNVSGSGGIDPLLDRLRTMTNVTGDLAVATLVGHWNGEVDFTGGSWSGGEVGAVPSDD